MAELIAAGAAPWALVLAGGESTRIQPWIRSWLGHHRPKQYCTFLGERSMLQHTLDRLHDVVPPARTLTVIGRHHRCFLAQALSGPAPGRVIEQPVSRGTAAGVFLPASEIIEEDPEATVMILPSDHFIHPTERFVHYLRAASLLVDRLRDRLVLLGAAPDGPEIDYGWIMPGQPAPAWAAQPRAPDPRPVAGFYPKPTQAEASRCYRQGGLWNTMIAVVKVRTLWQLGWRHLPDMMRRFETLRQVLRAIREGRVDPAHHTSAVEHVLTYVGTADFSRHLLERSTDSILTLAMEGVDWSDWGRPERVATTLARLGRRPAFPPSVATGHGRRPHHTRDRLDAGAQLGSFYSDRGRARG